MLTIVYFLLFLCASMAAGATGMLFPTGAWYRSLNKPSWVPPNWVFPVAWTSIYVLIAIGGAIVANSEGNGLALAFWAIQIALNTLWTPVFFGLRHFKASLIIMAALWVTIFCALIAHWSLSTWAGLAFVPYLAWLSLASCLNYKITVLNPDVKPLKLAEMV